MNKIVTLITCTGHRPEAFKLCHKYMVRQTYKDDFQWIVVNDAYTEDQIEDIKTDYAFELYAGPKKWQAGLNTQALNMQLALSKARGDKILFIEDDDLYKPEYIETMVKLLDFADIAGEGNAKYYHLGMPGFKEMKNFRHCSLSQTGITRKMVPALNEAIASGEVYFDIHLWDKAISTTKRIVIFTESNLSIGMKGLPGRPGIGAGHKLKDYIIDPSLVKLKEWVGNDYLNYVPFLKGKPNGRNTKPAAPAVGSKTAASTAQRPSSKSVVSRGPIGSRQGPAGARGTASKPQDRHPGSTSQSVASRSGPSAQQSKPAK